MRGVCFLIFEFLSLQFYSEDVQAKWHDVFIYLKMGQIDYQLIEL